MCNGRHAGDAKNDKGDDLKQKDMLELEIAAAMKAMRTAIRLRHSLEADEEINRVLPELKEHMLREAAMGKPFKLDLRSVFE